MENYTEFVSVWLHAFQKIELLGKFRRAYSLLDQSSAVLNESNKYF